MSRQSVGFICGIFHPKLRSKHELKDWQFREDELDMIYREFLGKPVLFEHEGEQIGRVEEIRIADWGEELLCYLDIYSEGQFVMDMLEKGKVLGLSVGYDSYRIGGQRLGKFEGQEISITAKPQFGNTWIVCNYSKGEFRISATGVSVLTQNPKKKLVKSQIKMSEYKAGKELLEAQGLEKNASQLDVESLRVEYEKARREAENSRKEAENFRKEAEKYKNTYKQAFESTVKPELDTLLHDIDEWIAEGYVSADAANALKTFVAAPSNAPIENIIGEKLGKIRATASVGGSIKSLSTQLKQERAEREKLQKMVEESAKRPRLEEEIRGNADELAAEQKSKQQFENDFKAWDNFLQAKSNPNKPESYYNLPTLSNDDVGKSLDAELQRCGF